MVTHQIPRKEIGAPALAHLKEVNTAKSVDSGWDIPEDGRGKRKNIHFGAGATTGWAISDRFNRILPPHKRFLGRSRRTFLIGILVLFVCILALIIGLAAGLGKGSNKYVWSHIGLNAHNDDTCVGPRTYHCTMAQKNIPEI